MGLISMGGTRSVASEMVARDCDPPNVDPISLIAASIVYIDRENLIFVTISRLLILILVTNRGLDFLSYVTRLLCVDTFYAMIQPF